MKPKALAAILPAFVLLMTLNAVLLAVGGDPQILFTDNVAATCTTTAVTLEAFLDEGRSLEG